MSKNNEKINGTFVVLLGPDGCGKSTLAHNLIKRLKDSGHRVFHFHWRPNLLPPLRYQHTKNQVARAVAPPSPDQFAYGYTISFIRYMYYLTDFIFGYWLVIFPRRAKNMVVIGERWYFDVLLYPARYGFRLPQWLLHLGGWFVAKPDLTILLEADPIAIHKRKPELSVSQIEEQFEAMRKTILAIPKSGKISTDCPVAESLDMLFYKVTSAIYKHSNTQSTVRQYWAFPSSKNIKIWVSENDLLYHALQLYQPYSFFGRSAKSMSRLLPKKLYPYILSKITDGENFDRLNDLSEFIRKVMDNPKLTVSFSTGTPGPNNKITAQVSFSTRILAYVKISNEYKGIAQLEREADVLNKWSNLNFDKSILPQVLTLEQHEKDKLLFLFPPNQTWRQRPLRPDKSDAVFLISLAKHDTQLLPYHQIRNDMKHDILIDRLQNKHKVMSKQLMLTLEALQHNLSSEEIVVTPCHGDYAPWNTLQLHDGKLYVFDWEYARAYAPALVDVFHRVFMPAWLVHHNTPEQAIARLNNLWQDNVLGAVTQELGIPSTAANTYILFYIINQLLWKTREKNNFPSYLLQCLDIILNKLEYLYAK